MFKSEKYSNSKIQFLKVLVKKVQKHDRKVEENQ
jgi:hypothetical protein